MNLSVFWSLFKESNGKRLEWWVTIVEFTQEVNWAFYLNFKYLYFNFILFFIGYLHAKDWLIWKDPDAGKDWGHEEKGVTEDEMVGWHHQLNGHEFEQTPSDSEDAGEPSMLQLGPQRVGHDLATEQ